MDVVTLHKIIGEYFQEYPILPNINAILVKVNACELNEFQVERISRNLRRNAQFFECKDATQYGLLNLFMYAIDAMYVPEEKWNPDRYEITAEYKKLLMIQEFFTINLQ